MVGKRWVLLSLVAVLTACSGDGKATDKIETDAPAVDSAGDTAALDTATPDAGGDQDDAGSDTQAGTDVEDVSAPEDATVSDDAGPDGDDGGDAGSDVAACPGQPGCACQTHADCPKSACIDRKDGSHICATPCTDATGCATGEVCRDISEIDSILMACVETDLVLCDPCLANQDCQLPGYVQAVCAVHPGGQGSFCAYNCVKHEECPGGFACQADVVDTSGSKFGRCMPTSGSCTCTPRAGQKDLTTSCGLGGICKGERSCTIPIASLPLQPTLTACDAPGPGIEACNGLDDDCDGETDEGTATGCNDDTACTVDACVAGNCSHVGSSGPCDDDDVCTVGDSCDGDTCLPGAATACTDANPCTQDGCDAKAGCTFVNAVGACSDGDACTAGDSCQDGACLPGSATVCDDKNPCTDDSCDPAKGCVQLANAVTCSDGDDCTVADSCSSGTCKGAPRLCDDANACTQDVCLAGACTGTAIDDCTSCFSETFPMGPVFAGKASSDKPESIAWSLQPSASGAPYSLGAGWTTGSLPLTATWTLPVVTMGAGTTLEFHLEAELSEPGCGPDDLELLVGDLVVKTWCATPPSGVQVVALTLPASPTPTQIALRVRGGTGGKVRIDYVAIGGACTAMTCAACATGLACNKGTGACEYHVVLSEVATQGPASSSDEFVELYNPGDTPATLTGLLLQYRAATSTTNWINKVAGGLPNATIAAHGYFLIASKSYVGTVGADLALTVDMVLAATAGSLQLLVPNAIAPIDLLGYGDTLTFDGKPAGSPTAAGSLERKAHAASTAGSMSTGSDQGAGNGLDSDVNGFDWIVRSSRQPQGKASPLEP